jgi:polyisoprenoid-binding protein YceI
MNEEQAPPESNEATEAPGIALQINGKGLLVTGNFGGWQSRLVLGPDLDQVGVNLFVDATSVRNRSDEDVGQKLFSFRSRSVASTGRGRYRLVGDFTGAEPTRELEMEMETTLGHTPLFVLSFAAEKKDFGDHWGSLVENAAPFGIGRDDGGPVREATAWLRAPQLAAA